MLTKVKVGDLFTINAVGTKISIGQVLSVDKRKIYVVVFQKLYDGLEVSSLDLSQIPYGHPAIVGRTVDVFFRLNRWQVIGNAPVVCSMDLFPNYKIETLEGVFVMNFDRQIIRNATKDEESFYFFYNEYSPAYLVSALKAYHGELPLDSDYLKLTYDFLRKRSNYFN